MKNLLIFLVLCGAYLTGMAQCDYVTPRFGVTIESNVFYGTAVNFDGSMDSLFMDVYKPINDPNDKKPLAVWCFGGGFIQGQREDFADLCYLMAERGYVAATIDYRLGYVNPNFLPLPFAYDSNELLRAGFRAMQDAKGAIRFLKNRNERDGTDVNNVFVGGGSAGAITALAAAFLRKDDDINAEVIGNLPTTQTDPPMTRPALGPISGSLHLGDENADVRGVLNIFGALFDVRAIEADDEIAIYSYHQQFDPVVPCERDQAYWGIPLINTNMPMGSGSCAIDQYLTDIGYNDKIYKTWIHDGDQHAMHDEDAIIDDAMEFLEDIICGPLADQESTDLVELEVFPNPAVDQLIIRADNVDDLENVIVVDARGHEVQLPLYNKGVIHVSHLPSGMYTLIVKERTQLYARFLKL